MGTPGRSEWLELARRAEDLGYSTLFVPDHLDDGQFSPISAMTTAMMATETLKVGSLVFNNDFRNPVVLAREMATLDVLSEGRLEIGIGAGWRRDDYDRNGIDFDAPSVRIARLGESLEIIRSLFRDGVSTFKGEHYQLEGAVGLPRTHSPGGPPLIVGGGGKKILSLAARYAQIVGINPSLAGGSIGDQIVESVGPVRFSERSTWVREAAGERFDDIELQCLTFAARVADDAGRWLAEMSPAFGLEPERAREIPIVVVGTKNEVVEMLQQRREQFGLSYWVIHQHEMDEFAPVVDALRGG